MTRATEHAAMRRRPGTSVALVGLFAIYLALLAWIVLLRFQLPWAAGHTERQVKLVPFVATESFGASDPEEVLANLLLFVPFGIYLGALRPSWSWWRATAAFVAASIGLEVAQYLLATGSSDVTDVVVNTAGGILGLILLALVRGVLRARTSALVLRVCAAGTALALLAVAWFVASPIQYGPPGGPDGRPARSLESP
ncbi:VanZ family protein [Agromyces sp. ZXT2-3]|uniref:VanZ family protein n=1 Tax=Agromyces sp. ZXT2-3 TaxID=3461152 RepID=UPI004054EC9F